MESRKRVAVGSFVFALLIRTVSAFFTGCAGARPQTKARCNQAPQWTTVSAEGQHIGVFVCFGEENHLLYVARQIPAPAVVKPKPAKKVTKKKRKRKRKKRAPKKKSG